ncbi:uncharacterized protein MYCFIDRAFT_175914 [Pseudocercospora fijiensis CIRAD86]|uniref:Uncharacterized protein n=1 Tax=Pseudocercospora fijiensis (strain CIRAD86) TaxID=383855 RepID=M3AYV1_PSEFD|nr:uncharacterized protein MYCFIDRAFT_175914 [Pseudocercospora fijiensis CIRAD86]EME82377.1 hypothetical protein MYCFIDRAFT_175914 [Pseudocercospora fijiensis CIRAD86]
MAFIATGKINSFPKTMLVSIQGAMIAEALVIFVVGLIEVTRWATDLVLGLQLGYEKKLGLISLWLMGQKCTIVVGESQHTPISTQTTSHISLRNPDRRDHKGHKMIIKDEKIEAIRHILCTSSYRDHYFEQFATAESPLHRGEHITGQAVMSLVDSLLMTPPEIPRPSLHICEEGVTRSRNPWSESHSQLEEITESSIDVPITSVSPTFARFPPLCTKCQDRHILKDSFRKQNAQFEVCTFLSTIHKSAFDEAEQPVRLQPARTSRDLHIFDKFIEESYARSCGAAGAGVPRVLNETMIIIPSTNFCTFLEHRGCVTVDPGPTLVCPYVAQGREDFVHKVPKKNVQKALEKRIDNFDLKVLTADRHLCVFL